MPGGFLLADAAVGDAAAYSWLEHYSRDAAFILASAVELFAAVVIGVAAVRATWQAIRLFVRPPPGLTKEAVRLDLGRWLAVALEFEVGADILRTAIAPSWNDIGQLGAIIVLRTLLNFFLQREIDQAEARGHSVQK